ncbi:M35 family metallo-endopeptidase [Collimonas silvisoli]|uniref:M35 family metallo-endopeptidase n=1 Tax=Collimonas silvisoli TaxID=2825884 RepID=UPI001B8A8DD7|nr:M35 family metallo-endopeptidase [Collimonas silvisoli]
MPDPKPIHVGPDGTKFRYIGSATTTPTTDTSIKVITVYPETMCPNMTNEEFAKTVMRLRDVAVKLTSTRIANLNRWNADDRAEAIEWFGSDSEEVRSTLLIGLPQISRVLSSLKPSNFVRLSEISSRNLSCDASATNGNTTAAVCKPDTETHTIAIGPNFCEMPDEKKNFDTGQALDGDSKLLTLIHEVSHFNDTMQTGDTWYGIANSRRKAKAGGSIPISTADNIASYVVFAKRGKS